MLSVHLLGGFRVVAGGHEVATDTWRLRKGPQVVQLLALTERGSGTELVTRRGG